MQINAPTEAFIADAALAPTPTRARYRVLALLFALAALTYLDRLCISAAAPAIAQEFNLSPVQMGYIFSAFTFAYALFEIPSGWLGDRFGTRKTLTRIVLWWSAFTALTSLTFGFKSLFIVRLMFGAGEAGAIPNSACTVSALVSRIATRAGDGRRLHRSRARRKPHAADSFQTYRMAGLAFAVRGIWRARRRVVSRLALLVSGQTGTTRGGQRRRTKFDLRRKRRAPNRRASHKLAKVYQEQKYILSLRDVFRIRL